MTEPIDPAWRPDTGSMRHEFRFDPLHYGVGGDQQAAFKDRMRRELRQYGFLLTGEVAVHWRLLVDERSRWESDRGADVDNFAKLLDDGLCGPNGIMIDDVQVQSLEIHWQGTPDVPRFELTIDCQPEEWLTRPISLYELADGLWHPLPDRLHDNPDHTAQVLYGLDNGVALVKRLRHQLRLQHGLSAAAAYEATRWVGIQSRGLHTSRADASGIPRFKRREWMRQHGRPADLEPLADDQLQRMAAAIAATR